MADETRDIPGKDQTDQGAGGPKLYQDPLYEAKVLSPLAVAVIDTPEFQRLSGLRQLGFSELVYRGAVHTRFQHSVGTYFICRKVLRRIVQNHERLDLEHPGSHISPRFRQIPANSDLPGNLTTHQSKWRGLTEVVSIAALLHDLGHVPFGHTLEDEFAGIYFRHDSLAGARLFEMMFNERSGLARVFSDTRPRWLQKISNDELRKLIYVILSWKENIDGPYGFAQVLNRELSEANGVRADRLKQLNGWYQDFSDSGLFHPFMSDVVGNTICADLLDYIPRDRWHLGMEPRFHTRLQRYLTIREGTLYKDEGLRVSIMVTRKLHGGQRRDVATAVLDIMRERYEMSERVYYHHKKAAAGAMLAKLVELAGEKCKPRDDEDIYPAPWDPDFEPTGIPHMTHLSDQELIDYVGRVEVSAESRPLQRQLHNALRYCRAEMFRTLLVIDTSLAQASIHPLTYFARELRGTKERASSAGRLQLESTLAEAAGAKSGEVIVYCPSPSMQSKVVDARLEIQQGRVVPLRIQTESFAYHADLHVLQQYYDELWRAYIFVSPRIFADPRACQAIVDAFCQRFGIPVELAYKKVRTYEFESSGSEFVHRGLTAIHKFYGELHITNVPSSAVARFLALASEDQVLKEILGSGSDASERLSSLFRVAAIQITTSDAERGKKFKKTELTRIENYVQALLKEEKPVEVAARLGDTDFNSFVDGMIDSILKSD